MPNNTIVLVGELKNYHNEKRAAAALKPGHLLEVDSAGKYVKHATAGGKCRPIVAKENSFIGGTIDGNLPIPDGAGNTTYYNTDDVVFAHECQPGNIIQFLLKAGENADPSKWAVSAGDGTLKVWTNETADGCIVGKFEESLDLTLVGTAQFVKVKIR